MKKFLSAFVAVLFAANLSVSAYASVLGSSKVTGYSVGIGKGTTFTSNVFYSDQNGVGKQTENYITYMPNAAVTPIITNGKYLFGGKTISSEVERLSKEDINLVGGINADFFSLKTGVPMSNLVVNGEIITKDASGQDSLGIMEDGTAFMSYVQLFSVLIRESGEETLIHNINKYRQPYAIYMMTDKFSDTTKNETEGIDVILGSVDGKMKIGEMLEAVVEAVEETKGEREIPKGKIILTVDKNAPEEYVNSIASLEVGEKVKISFGVQGDERWKDIYLGMGAVGGKLITKGEINPNLEDGAAPRSAIGIKDDGTIILYTIDGRQTGHSYGVKLKTLAERMRELGCVEAINLDGGGSTSIVSLLPGDKVASLKNSPSDGKERKVSTFFFLENNQSPTGKAGTLVFYPFNCYMLYGATASFELKMTDTAFYPMELPDKPVLSVETQGAKSVLSQNGVFEAKDEGVIRIKAESGGAVARMDVNILKTPTDIKLKNEKGEYINKIQIEPGKELKLYAEAYGGYNVLIGTNEHFNWETEGDIGTISENGVFVSKEHVIADGKIIVSAGEKKISVPVSVSYKPDERDKKNYPQISAEIVNDIYYAKLSNEYDIPVLKDKINLYADGEKIDFDYSGEEGEVKAEIPLGTNKITIYVTNKFDFTTCYTKEVEEYTGLCVFYDTEGHWAEEILSYMYEKDIISGENTKEGLIFRPQKEMTRAEFSVMMCNYLGINTEDFENVNLPFTDSEEIPKWARGSIKALYEKKILTGKTMPDGSISSAFSDKLTRAEAATIISRTLPEGFYKEKVSLSDAGDIPKWAETGIETLVSIGAMKGYTDGTIKPLGYLTKAEAAKLIYSIM